MSAAPREMVDSEILANLSPLNNLDPERFNEVASRAKIKQFKKGEYLFREGHSDRHTFYVIKGRIALLSQASEIKTIDGGSEESTHPLAPELPRKFTARVQSTSTVVMIDTTVLDFHMGRNHTKTYEVNDIHADDDNDWMTRVLQSEAFSKLPPISLQRMLSGVTEVPYNSGETVIEQGQKTEHYFIVKSGVCCDASPTTQEWRCGDAFGVSGLILDSGHYTKVTMKSSGQLMLLPKADFIELCYKPMVDNTDGSGVKEQIDNGAKWLDVRPATSRIGKALHNSICIPFPELSQKAASLDKFQSYIVIGEHYDQANVGAFILRQNGLTGIAFNDEFSAIDTDLIDQRAVDSAETLNELNTALLNEQKLKQALEEEKQRLINEVAALKAQQTANSVSSLGEGLSLVDDGHAAANKAVDTTVAAPEATQSPDESHQLKTANAALQKHLDALKKQLEAETGQRKLAQDNYATFLKKVKRYKRGNDALINKLKIQLTEAKNKLTNLLSQSASVDTDISKARAEIEQKTAALTAAEERLHKEQQRVSELEATLTQMRNELDHVGQEFEASGESEKVKLLQEKLKASAEEKRGLEEQLKSLQEDYDALENEHAEAALWNEMEDLQNALNVGPASSSDLNDLSDLLDDDIADDLNDLDFD